jgi:hypothetical protein
MHENSIHVGKENGMDEMLMTAPYYPDVLLPSPLGELKVAG